jgi:adenylosuccinate lyase
MLPVTRMTSYRYTLPEMGAIWTEENKFRKWLEVEVAACQANAEAGNIPADAVETIRRKAHFSVERIAELEQVTDHDVIAFTTNLAENIGPEARWSTTVDILRRRGHGQRSPAPRRPAI